MTVNLSKDLESSIRAEVDRGRFASVEHAIAEAVRLLLSQPGESLDDRGSVLDPSLKAIWEEIQDVSGSVPPEIWNALPTDLSAEHDHYIYGTTKRVQGKG